MSQLRFAILYNQTFHVLGMRHMVCKRIPSSMNKYNCTVVRYHVDAKELLVSLGTKCFVNLPLLINTQHYPLQDPNMPPMEADATYQGCLPFCELHRHDSRFLTVRRYSIKVRVHTRCSDCTNVLCNLWIGCVILRLILRMHNAILRLRKFSDCTEHMHVTACI